MSNTRNYKTLRPWAEDAEISIPEGGAVPGTSYRNTETTDNQSATGQAFKRALESGSFNQIFHLATKLVKDIETTGLLGWTNLIDYPVGAFVRGSDGRIYQAAEVSGPGTTPIDPVEGASSAWNDYLKPLEDAIGDNAQGIEDNTQAIEGNTEAIQQNTQAIEGNIEAIDNNSQAINQNEQDIQSNSQAIQQNTDNISSNTQSIDQNSQNILTLTETIANLASAQGQIQNENTPVFAEIPQIETPVPLSVLVDSTDTDVLEFNETTNTVTLKINASFNFLTSVFLDFDTGSERNVTFRIRRASDDLLISERILPLEESNNDKDQFISNNLVTVGKNGLPSAPLEVKLTIECDGNDIEFTSFDSLIT
ncbi:hypothetical protein F9L16_23870, partial [Agarivorans sp. B2Z047]